MTTCAQPWREVRFPLDLFAALRDVDLPENDTGEGAPVLIIPGFGTGDGAMWLFHRRLRTRGFRTYAWQQGTNYGPKRDTLRLLAARVREIARCTGQPVHLVGWSLGGLLARVLGARTKDHVGRVVTMGAPLSGDPDCSWISALLSRLSTPVAHRRFKRFLAEASAVPVTSIYSRQDGVVHWAASVEAAGDVAGVEVGTSHLGMVTHPEVVDAVATALR
jgi:pimeloyl-ACP methyl ester carboxylesterase